MKGQRQRFSDSIIGDCFRACMATILDLPIDVLPNDHSPAFYSVWTAFLRQFGLSFIFMGRKDPLWRDGYWIASVKSKNFEGGVHAIVMYDSDKVFFDPSPALRFKKNTSLIRSDALRGGFHLEVIDTTLLHRLEEYRQHLKGNK